MGTYKTRRRDLLRINGMPPRYFRQVGNRLMLPYDVVLFHCGLDYDMVLMAVASGQLKIFSGKRILRRELEDWMLKERPLLLKKQLDEGLDFWEAPATFVQTPVT